HSTGNGSGGASGGSSSGEGGDVFAGGYGGAALGGAGGSPVNCDGAGGQPLDDSCYTCGLSGQQCCLGNYCFNDAACIQGQCRAECGAPGQACCPGTGPGAGTRCQADHECSNSGKCSACGTYGKACCVDPHVAPCHRYYDCQAGYCDDPITNGGYSF
ncbi:MAG TPA: hypothetical protein VEQ58_12510, partial [Polyangiaceae bacterium]|nr:hypothetical protein [Polyangiaceae bacterium]